MARSRGVMDPPADLEAGEGDFLLWLNRPPIVCGQRWSAESGVMLSREKEVVPLRSELADWVEIGCWVRA